MMQSAQHSGGSVSTRKQRRATIACTACRQSKIKCSGEEPCANCRRRSLLCQFSEENCKILVSERYLRSLQKQAYNWQRATGVKRPRDDCFQAEDDPGAGDAINDGGVTTYGLEARLEEPPAPDVDELSCNIWTSPFTLPTTVIKDPRQEQRKWIWLAPSSAWSLTARLTVMMTEKLGISSDHDTPQFYLDGDIYPFAWGRETPSTPIDAERLPSLDYALHLFQIVRFRLGQAYRLFEEESFVARIHEFYVDGLDKRSAKSDFWFIQFLMVIALGNAFTSRNRCQKDPPGSKYFARAMSAMPNYTSTGKDSLLAIEALALVGLYLYALDHREAAHLHLGHAIRIAQMEGMHTQLPEDALGAVTVARCQNIWWSLYTMDRQFSPSVGLPMTTKDNDITTLISLPTSRPRDLTFNLQVRLTRMLSFIISTIYKTDKTHIGEFLDITREILEKMAKYAEEIEKMIHVNFHGSMDNIPEETRYTILLYHQCVIVATRPLLLSVLKERLEKLGRAVEDWQKFLALPRSLISIGIKSASKVLQIIGDENDPLETFLPFELELTYSAALHLTMADTLFPSGADHRSNSHASHSILHELILCGNRIAEARKHELNRVEGLFHELARRVEQEGLRVLTLSDPVSTERGDDNLPHEARTSPVSLTEPGVTFWSSAEQNRRHSGSTPTHVAIDSLESIGISSYEFVAIANQISQPGNLNGALDVRPDWLAGADITESFI